MAWVVVLTATGVIIQVPIFSQELAYQETFTAKPVVCFPILVMVRPQTQVVVASH